MAIDHGSMWMRAHRDGSLDHRSAHYRRLQHCLLLTIKHPGTDQRQFDLGKHLRHRRAFTLMLQHKRKRLRMRGGTIPSQNKDARCCLCRSGSLRTGTNYRLNQSHRHASIHLYQMTGKNRMCEHRRRPRWTWMRRPTKTDIIWNPRRMQRLAIQVFHPRHRQ
jgi:hypothetical protein